MASRISAVVRVRPLLPRELDVSVAEAVSVMEVSAQAGGILQVPGQSSAHDMHVLPAAAQLSSCDALQERYIRVIKENVNLESDFDHVLGQDASQQDVFDLARGNSAAPSAALCSLARHCVTQLICCAGCVQTVQKGYNSAVLA